MQESIYVGLDLGSSRCQQAIINADGSLRFSRIVPTSEQHLRDAFGGLEGMSAFTSKPESWRRGWRGLSTQRKILATMRAMWLSMKPYRDNGSEPGAAATGFLRSAGGPQTPGESFLIGVRDSAFDRN